jgi:hypothetical protein
MAQFLSSLFTFMTSEPLRGEPGADVQSTPVDDFQRGSKVLAGRQGLFTHARAKAKEIEAKMGEKGKLDSQS